MSSNIHEILEFYDSFIDRHELTEWIKDVPKSHPKLEEVGNLDSEIIVVIPTPSIEHKLSRNCQNAIFKGLKIVFSIDNSIYFNLSRSYNYGAKLLSNKKGIRWVIFSNVDMTLIDSPDKLMNELDDMTGEPSFCYAKGEGSHSYPIRVGEYTKLRNIAFNTTGKIRRIRATLERKYLIHINAEEEGNYFARKFVRRDKSMLNFGDFFIFSNDLLKRYNYEPFDERYLNGMEDIDLSMRLYNDLKQNSIRSIDYRIGSMKSAVRGRGIIRTFRNIPSLAYFNEKFEDQNNVY
jgi:hypothetical protein